MFWTISQLKKTAQLTRLGLTDEFRFPLWTLKTTFYWQQQFASGHETIIEHHYKPIVGVTAEYDSGTVGQDLKESGRRRKYCVDADFPKYINLDAELEASMNSEGKFTVTEFHLLKKHPSW